MGRGVSCRLRGAVGLRGGFGDREGPWAHRESWGLRVGCGQGVLQGG